jgi:hypothetical protein
MLQIEISDSHKRYYYQLCVLRVLASRRKEFISEATPSIAETKTPLMLLFVCNGTDQASVLSDTKQMLDFAYDNIEQNRMMPNEFENKDTPHFTLQVNVP